MGFCVKEGRLLTDGVTVITNKFILNYLPDAPPVAVSVYLLGLALSDTESQNSDHLAIIAGKLGISETEVVEAFYYWEELGLVHIRPTNNMQIVFLPVRESYSLLKKIKPSKYSKFSKEIQALLFGRMITPNEFNEYYMFLENTEFAPDALLAVAKYCADLRGNDISYSYILTVARNLLRKGISTLETVENSLNSQSKFDEDLKILFKSLRISRAIDFSDREYYEKWKLWGFSLDVLCSIAKNCKSGGMKQLDSRCEEYHKNSKLSIKEIEDYINQKQHFFDIAKKVTNSIGVYYQSLDAIVEEYVSKWVDAGFDSETLTEVAKFCFRSGIRTLRDFADVIDKFQKKGLTSFLSIAGYIEKVGKIDNEISKILSAAGLLRKVTLSDRQLYKIWTENWGFSSDLIIFAAEKAIGANNPLQYLNKILQSYKNDGITTVEQAKTREKSVVATAAKPSTVSKQAAFPQHEYSDEQLKAMFTSLEDLEF